jgi:hypothetical protein
MDAIVLFPEPDTPVITATKGLPAGGSDGILVVARRGTVDEPHQLAF